MATTHPLRSRLAASLIGAACLAGAATAATGAQAAPSPAVASPACSLPGVAGSLASIHAWAAISGCEWSADYLAADGPLEFRVSTDDGLTWSAPAAAEQVTQADADHLRASVRVDAEGVQRVQFRRAGDPAAAWAGSEYVRVDRSGPQAVVADAGRAGWSDQGSAQAMVLLDAHDPLSGPSWIEVRQVLATGGEAPGPDAAWWARGGCGERFATPCASEPAPAGHLRAKVAVPAGDWWLSARACDAVWNCGPWSEPVRKRVGIRDGDAASLLIGTPGTDRIAAGGGADTLSGGAGDDLLLAGPGADRIRAGAGADVIKAGAGADTVDAGGGADVIVVRGGGRDRVRCGPGRDTVRADRSDRVARDCERVIRR